MAGRCEKVAGTSSLPRRHQPPQSHLTLRHAVEARETNAKRRPPPTNPSMGKRGGSSSRATATAPGASSSNAAGPASDGSNPVCCLLRCTTHPSCIVDSRPPFGSCLRVFEIAGCHHRWEEAEGRGGPSEASEGTGSCSWLRVQLFTALIPTSLFLNLISFVVICRIYVVPFFGV